MFAIRRVASARVVTGLAVASSGGCLWYANGKAKCEAPSDSAVQAVTRRLGAYVKNIASGDTQLQPVLRSEKEGVTIFSVADQAAHDAAGGLPVCRIARTEIKAPVSEVAKLWADVGSRKNWDSVNTENSALLKKLAPNRDLVYVCGKPKRGGVISSRDFVYTINKVDPKTLGAPPGSVLYVQVDAAEDEPVHKGSVRGNVNSLLLMEPIGQSATRVSYAIEIEIAGWIPKSVVNAAADETPMVIAEMRKHLTGV